MRAEFDGGALSSDFGPLVWLAPFRVVLKAEVMALGENPQFVVTSLTRPEPEDLYQGMNAPRGQDENFIENY